MPGGLLIILLTLGGVGLYLALPGGRLNLARAALVLLAGAGAALVALLLPLAGEHGQQVWFALLSLIALAGAVRVVTHRKPVYSALYFILVVVAVAGLVLLEQAEFLAVALLVIYAGAILVTYMFVIMLAQQSGGPAPYDQSARAPLTGVVTGFILLGTLTWRLTQPGARPRLTAYADLDQAVGQVIPLGTHLLTQYMVGVEITGLLLLAALVGAVAIARRRRAATEPEEEAA